MMLVLVLTAACGSIATTPDAAEGSPDAPAGLADAAPGASDAAVRVLSVTITAPATFTSGVCSAPGVFKFKVEGGPAGGVFDWSSDLSDGDLVPASATGVALDGTGAASVDLSLCTPPMGVSQTVTINVTTGVGSPAASDTVTIGLN